MKILVTGGSGFIGSAFVRLAAAGGHEVMVLSRQNHADPTGPVRWTQGSLKDPNWDEILSFRPDACLHAAWIVESGPNWESPENESCLAESISFLSRLRNSGLRHVVVAGTCAEYGSGDRPLTETNPPLSPASLYARTKDALRIWGEREFAFGASTFCWARIFYAYGPGESASRLPSRVIMSLLQGLPCTIKTPAARKDYIYVDDVAAALLLLTLRGQSGAFNIGTGEGIALGDLARMMAEQFGSENLLIFPEPNAKDSLGDRVANVDRLLAAGFTPAWSLSKGISALGRCIQEATLPARDKTRAMHR